MFRCPQKPSGSTSMRCGRSRCWPYWAIISGCLVCRRLCRCRRLPRHHRIFDDGEGDERPDAGSFSFLDFSVMRLRRIFPALAVVIVASAVLGWFVTLPGEYLKHLRQASHALAFLSNFAFDNDNGYFAMAAAQTKPLLHTWSLAVEWQFYIWMPLLVSLVWRLASASKSMIAATMLTLQAIAALSLAWCLWESQHVAMARRFSRCAPEHGSRWPGGLIAAAELRRRVNGVARVSWMNTAARRRARLGPGSQAASPIRCRNPTGRGF